MLWTLGQSFNKSGRLMDTEDELPLDISEFTCVGVSASTVVIVFSQTDRRYTYTSRNGELDLAHPFIQGKAGAHPPEVIDCLARAVAYQVARKAFGPSRTPDSKAAGPAIPRPPKRRGLFQRSG